MKAVILAGGSGTRLHPLTLVTNKHLLPVYDKPVIYYAIEKLVAAGITKIMIVTAPHNVDAFVRLLGSGQRFTPKDKEGNQIQIVYGIQNEPQGIAQGLYIAKDYVGNEDCVLCLGDNIILDDIAPHIEQFSGGATVFLKKVDEPHRFGIATLKDGKVVKVVEKPQNPESDLAVVGLYIYDNSVFKKLIGQPMSDRGEYEITYINNLYIDEGKLNAAILEQDWFDIGTIDSLHAASDYMRRRAEHGKQK